MLSLARLPRLLTLVPLLAAAVSTAPLVHWCPLPWSQVSVEDFVACGVGSGDCATSCEAECDTPPAPEDCSHGCTSEPPCSDGAPHGCTNQPAPEGGRAYCLEAPIVGAPGPGSPGIHPPLALAAIVPAGLPREPECVAALLRPAETPQPRSRPPGLPPPVRGPPCVA